ncbi:MAG: glycosyltransferase [Chloroflexi bacterium]|nr:glycosyltransferase [Chloroflexota bacterium]
MARPFLSVVIPAYNEASNIQSGALDQVAGYLSRQSFTYEVVIVDDGSLDATAELARSFAESHPGFRVISSPHRGKAHAVTTGLLSAEGELVLFSDMDQATPLDQVSRLIPWYEQGYDVIIGSRGRVRRNAPAWRKLMSISQIMLRNIILGFSQVSDTQCGFKAFRREAIHPILDGLSLYAAVTPDGTPRGAAVTSGFDVELLFVAHRLGYRIREVPVEWDYHRTRRVNLFKDALRGLNDLVRIRLADLRGVYSKKVIDRRQTNRSP